MELADFNYDLPKDLIAQYPLKKREKCRLMVLDRTDHSIAHKMFEDIVGFFKKGDCLVLNDTKVLRARLFGKRKTGGKVELFLLDALNFHSGGGDTRREWKCEALIRPSARLREGERITLESGEEAEILDRGGIGRCVKFFSPLDKIIENAGHVPLPPYINRSDEQSDKSDYQTVFAAKEGATASPTAGLHFTDELIERVRGQGSRVRFVTLHTSYGTFAPIKTDDVESHRMHKEYFELPAETARVIRDTKERGGKVFAVGTTSTRVLEHCAEEIVSALCSGRDCKGGQRLVQSRPVRGYTDMYIYPGYKFKIVDHLVTNFHLPKSTLLLLVSAFAGREFILEAYRRAIEEKYRFFSYGDAMLIL